jgi:hypothetical protein
MRRPEHLSVIAHGVDPELVRIRGVVEQVMVVEDRGELEAQLSRLSRTWSSAPRTLDLIGHSTAHGSLLCLGDWVIDAGAPAVTAFFRGLVDAGVFERLGITALRLLGCETALSDAGRATILRLAQVTGLEVYGTHEMLYAGHYDSGGFRDDHAHTLVSASELANECELSGRSAIPTHAPAYRRTLDIEALPVLWPGEPTGMSSRHAVLLRAGIEDTRRILALVRRSDGAYMPGLLVRPSHAIALAALRPGAYYLLEVLLDGTFVRAYPDGMDRPGVVFPVSDPEALLALIDTFELV